MSVAAFARVVIVLVAGVVGVSCKDKSAPQAKGTAQAASGQAPARTPGEEAHRLVEAGATLLDVRLPEEYQESHIKGAINIPVHELERRMSELGAKDKPIVVYCHSGGRSAQATALLEQASFAKVFDLGPMDAW
ncbi:MAG: rhodanese-like domain-containing protein [Deltaproteobacteria bacterium]|nr:rhodanese-like domain-containing protein [Deltaproteobacteria bacterium]